MNKNPKKLLLFSVVIMIFLNHYLKNHTTSINDNFRTAIEITIALASIAFFIFSLRQDKENARKKLILAGIYVAITIMITFFFLFRI